MLLPEQNNLVTFVDTSGAPRPAIVLQGSTGILPEGHEHPPAFLLMFTSDPECPNLANEDGQFAGGYILKPGVPHETSRGAAQVGYWRQCTDADIVLFCGMEEIALDVHEPPKK